MPAYDVICLGQAVLDCITRGAEANPYKPNVYRAETISLHIGGDAVNESVALKSLGHNVAAVFGTGDDLAGNILRAELQRAGVDIKRASVCAMDTPIASLQVKKDGSRTSVNSNATRLPGYVIDPEALRGARVVSFASLFRPPLADMEHTIELIRAAKASGAVVCADTKLPLDDSLRMEALFPALSMIDYIFPNEKEAEYYTGESAYPAMAQKLLSMGVKNVIIKAGAEGCYVAGQGEAFQLPAIPVERVQDTTGAGDNFVAGFISGILRGAPLKECALSGLQQAARVIAHAGGARVT